MNLPQRARTGGAALFLTVLGMLSTAAVSAAPHALPAAAPQPPPKPMTTANPKAFALEWANDRRAQAIGLRAAVNPGGNRVTVGSMLDAANIQAHTQDNSACNRRATQNPRSALYGVRTPAFYCLDNADATTTAWTPQGVSGTEDAEPAGTVDGHRAIAFSWHSGPEGKQGTGTRLSFLDRKSNKYIHVLLVAPTLTGASFGNVSVHAGGIVWYQHYIFVADNERGLRVFDTDNLLHLVPPKKDPDPNCTTIGRQTQGPAAGTYCGLGYDYLLPEIGRWRNPKSSTTRYDSVSLVRAGGQSPVIVTSEFRRDSVGRVARWRVADLTPLVNPAPGARNPFEAWHQPMPYVQGALALDCYYFNTGGGQRNRYLIVAKPNSKAVPMSSFGGRGLQDLYWLRSVNQLWTLTEHADLPGVPNRFLYGVARPGCPIS